jgi:hypothetical protein
MVYRRINRQSLMILWKIYIAIEVLVSHFMQLMYLVDST